MSAAGVEFHLTKASEQESSKLQRHFGRLDILSFLICTIVGVDTIATVASGGGQAFTWMVVFAFLFFIPQALLFAELGTAFPQEGGPYMWPRLAFGHLVGAINNFLYWVTNPVWLGGSLAFSAITAIEVFFDHGHIWSGVPFYATGIVFIWVSVLAAVLSFRVGKWLPTLGALSRVLLLGIFTAAVIAYAARHGIHGLDSSAFKTSKAGFVLLVGVLLFNFVGFELPSAAGEEMVNPSRDVPFAIARSAVGAFFLYAIPVLGILIVIPASQVTGFGGFIDAVQQVFTVFGGHLGAHGPILSGAGRTLGDLCAVLFVICLITSGVTWIMGSDRSLAVSGYDGAAPRSLGVINAKLGTPVRVNVMSGVVSTITLVLAEEISSGSASKFFDVVLGITISTTLVSYLFIYPALIKLRRLYPDVHRPFTMPLAWPLTVILMVLLTVSVIEIFAPGLGTSWFGTDFLPSGWSHSERWVYLLTETVPVAAFILIGIGFWFAGRPTRSELSALTVAATDEGA